MRARYEASYTGRINSEARGIAAKAKPAGGKSPSTRASERRAELTAKGYAQKNWLLSPEALKNLARACHRERCTETEAVELALALAAKEGLPQLNNEQLLKLVGRRLRPDGVR